MVRPIIRPAPRVQVEADEAEASDAFKKQQLETKLVSLTNGRQFMDVSLRAAVLEAHEAKWSLRTIGALVGLSPQAVKLWIDKAKAEATREALTYEPDHEDMAEVG